MGGHVEHLQRSPEHGHVVLIFNGDGLKRNSRPIRCSGNDGRLRPVVQQVWGAADVVGMVVGLQDHAQRQPPFHQPAADGGGDGGIHHSRLVSPHPDPDHVVLKHRQGMERGRHR